MAGALACHPWCRARGLGSGRSTDCPSLEGRMFMRASRLLVLAAAMALGCSTQIIGGSTAGTGAGAGTGGGNTCVGAACACGNTATIERMTTNAVDKIDIVL